MPSDAAILREGGVEALRKHWREKSRRQEQRLREIDPEATRERYRENNRRWRESHPRSGWICRWCKQETAVGNRICDACRVERFTYPCDSCGTVFQRTGHGGKQRKYCSPACRGESYRRQKPTTGKACPIRARECKHCGRLFTAHGRGLVQKLYCSSECSAAANVIYNRNVQRRTHSIAIRYWQYDQSPEAESLATQYFQLRQMMRRIRRGEPQN